MSTASSAAGNSSYFVHVEGLPRGYTWKDLKDLIRNVAYHGVWTEMAVLPNGEGSGTGYARVQRADEAENLYKFLTRRKDCMRLNVHLWDISDNCRDARFLKCNCPGNSHLLSHAVMRDLPLQARHTSFWRNVPTPQGHVNPQVPVYTQHPQLQYTQASFFHSAQPPPYGLAQPMQGLPIPQTNPPYASQSQYAHILRSVPQQPSYTTNYSPEMYAASSNGLPVNIGQGFAVTERRGIFVSEMDYDAKIRDIKRHFEQVGPIVKIEIPKKGTATIRFNTAAEAKAGVDRFHGKVWRDRRLKVRLDKERTTVEPPSADSSSRQRRGESSAPNSNPIIVNGSTVQGNQAQGRL